MDRLLEQESTGSGGDPKVEAISLTERITGCDRLRRAYQDQNAAGLMTLEELAVRLEELERDRDRDRDAVIQSYAGMVPGALEALSGEEAALRDAPPGGHAEARWLRGQGALSTSGSRSTVT
jgi:hypothetical protein